MHKRCITTLSEIDSLTVPQDFVGEPFNSQKFFLSEIFMDRKGISQFSLEFFLSHSTEKIPSVTLLSEKNSGLKKLYKMVYHEFVENWFSHSTENFRRGTLLFSEKFFYRNFLWIGKGYHDSLWKFFCLTVPKKIAKSTLLFQENSGLKKLHKMVYHDFVENWVSQSTEKLRRGTLLFSEFFLYRKSFRIGGGYHDFLSKLFCLTVPKNFLGGPFFSENFWNKEIALDGVSRFCRKLIFSQYRKLS